MICDQDLEAPHQMFRAWRIEDLITITSLKLTVVGVPGTESYCLTQSEIILFVGKHLFRRHKETE